MAVVLNFHLEYVACLDALEQIATKAALCETIEGRRAPRYLASGDVAVIKIEGLIHKYPLAAEGAVGRSYVELADDVNAAASDESVRGILLLIDSSGGSVGGLDRLVRAIERARQDKPVCAWVGRRCAGTIMVAAAACQKIYASPKARIGCVGPAVIALGAAQPGGGVGADPPIFDPLDVDTRHLEQMGKILRGQIAACRGLDPEKLRDAIEDRLLIAEQGEAHGLVDGILPMEAAIDRVGRGDLGGPQ